MSFQLVKKQKKSEKKEPSGSLNENCVLQPAAGCVFKHKQNSVVFPLIFFFFFYSKNNKQINRK